MLARERPRPMGSSGRRAREMKIEARPGVHRSRLRSPRRVLAGVLAGMLIASGGAAAANSTPVALVPSASALKGLGLRPSGAGTAGARSVLESQLPSGLRGLIARAPAGAAAGRARGRTAGFDAFVLRSASAARLVLNAWSRRNHATKTRIGDGGGIAGHRSGRRARFTVLWREGPKLGLVTLSVTRAPAAARGLALAYAELADGPLSTALPTTAWQAVLDQVRPNGSVSKSTALEAFSLAYGRLPGVRPPKGRRAVTEDGTQALLWGYEYEREMTRAQRTAFDRLGGLEPPGRGAHAAEYGDDGFTPNADVEAMAQHWAGVYEARLGHTLGLRIVAGYTTTVVTTPKGGLVYADAWPMNAEQGTGGEPVTCRIRVMPSGKEQSAEFLNLIVAHEVFHCFQFDFRGSLAWNGLPAWIMEGTADWAAITVDPVPYTVSGGNLTTYVTTSGTPLFTRSYDAVGFWGHVQDTYGNLFARIRSILNAGSNIASFHNAGGDASTFLDSWGSSVFNQTTGGEPWLMASPISPPASVQPVVRAPARLGLSGLVEADPYTTSQYVVDGFPNAPMMHVEISGYARLSQELNVTQLQDDWFCTSGTCTCPPNTISSLPARYLLPVPARLGLAADDAATHGSVTFYPLKVFCKPKKAPTPKGQGIAQVGSDPWLMDFDRDVYDFQGAGEYTLLKSTRDDFQVQVRMQPLGGPYDVSAVTAIAMRINRATVEVDGLPHFRDAVYVDKRLIDAATFTRRVGGGRLRVLASGPIGGLPEVTLTWPDGTSVQTVNAGSGEGAHDLPILNTTIRTATHRARELAGLVGNWDVPAADEFVGRTGRHYPKLAIVYTGSSWAPPLSELRTLYDSFGNSWRITQGESLFRYPRGKSTRSYTIRGFPSFKAMIAIPGLPKITAAKTACTKAGVTNAHVLKACEVDVIGTGSTKIAKGDRQLQKSGGLPATPPPPPLRAINLGAGSQPPRVVYDPTSGATFVVWLDQSGTSIDVCAVRASAPDCNGGGGPDRLTDPLANAGASPGYDSPQLIVQPGGQVVVLADASGVSAAATPAGYPSSDGVVAWSSPASGSAFGSPGQGLADGGLLLADGTEAGDMPAGGAVALDDDDIGVYGDEYPFGNGFTDFTLTAGAPATTPTVDGTGAYGNPIDTDGIQVASVPDPSAPGQYVVVVVGAAQGAPGACPAGTSEATGYGVATGTPSELQSQTAWSSGYFKPISCQAFSPALAGGGASGGTIGLLEDEGPGITGSGGDGVYFRRFDVPGGQFGPPVLVSDETQSSLDGAIDLSLSEDPAGGVYAVWEDERGTLLTFSPDGGAQWGSAALLNLPESESDPVIAGVGGGNAELAYDSGGEEYVVPLSYSALAG